MPFRKLPIVIFFQLNFDFHKFSRIENDIYINIRHWLTNSSFSPENYHRFQICLSNWENQSLVHCEIIIILNPM